MDSVQFRDVVERFIELDGARTGEIGDSIHAGFAWIQDAKVIFLAEGVDEDYQLFAYQPDYQPDYQPCDFHQFSRFVNVSAQLKRPVLLWNLFFQIPAFAEQNLPLVMHHAIQNSELQLLKLPLPIIGVFDASRHISFESESALVDGLVLVGTEDTAGASAPSSPRVKIANTGEGIKEGILDLLADVSAISGDTLVAERFRRLQQIVEQRD